jgi:alanine racemase
MSCQVVSGAPKAYNENMSNFLTWLSKRRFPYEPLITVEISKSRLVYNLNEFRKFIPNGAIAPVLKSNAYGHGLVEVAKILEIGSAGWRRKSEIGNSKTIPFFIVDSYFEAVALRAKHLRTPILVIGYARPETIAGARLKHVSFTIANMETLRSLAKKTKKENSQGGTIDFRLPIAGIRHLRRVHLKIDTGMKRQGILPEEIPEAMEIINNDNSIILEGICSHLCDADNEDESFTDGQIALWNRMAKQFRDVFPRLKYWHLSNTDGHRFHNEIDANVSRLGIGLYGLTDGNSFKPPLGLQPAMEMKTIITGAKKIKAGDTVGYGNTFTAMDDMTVATIPVGYFEGLDRRLSNKGFVLIGESRVPCPIIGRVSMNITIIDVTNIPNVIVGMPVIVISNNPADENSIVKIAEKCKTITYEIAVKIPGQLKRVIVN